MAAWESRGDGLRDARTFLAILLFAVVSIVASGQQTTSLPAAPQQDPAAAKPGTGEEAPPHRALKVVPMFDAVPQNAPPLTDREKLRLFRKSALDPFWIVPAAAQAGISQAADNFHDYGQGAEGYGKRFGAAIADRMSSKLFSELAYPVILRQDPRYFRRGQGTTSGRIGYALAQGVVCRSDDGGRAFNWSNVLGNLTSGGISNAYYPERDRGIGLTMSRFGLSLAYGEGKRLLLEFWPDISRRFFRKGASGPSPQPSPSR